MKNKNFDELSIVQKNDRYLVTANTMLLVCLVAIYGFTIVAAILLFIAGAIMQGVLTLIISSIATFLCYIFAKLILSVVFDIKMIRNKLYNFENENICRLYDDSCSDRIRYTSEEIEKE